MHSGLAGRGGHPHFVYANVAVGQQEWCATPRSHLPSASLSNLKRPFVNKQKGPGFFFFKEISQALPHCLAPNFIQWQDSALLWQGTCNGE